MKDLKRSNIKSFDDKVKFILENLGNSNPTAYQFELMKNILIAANLNIEQNRYLKRTK